MTNQKSKKIQQNELVSNKKAITRGNMIKFAKNGDKVMKFYYSFEYDGNVFELGDFVLVRPATMGEKPFVRIIKAIASDSINRIMVTTQWFYRPEETKNKEGKCYKAHDKRELYYSFRHEDILAESILHKFIVQKVYDFVENKLHDLTDSDLDEKKQQEIDLHVKRTQERIGDSTNTVVKTLVNKMDSFKRKQTNLYRAEPTTEINKLLEAYAGCAINVSKYHTSLAKYQVSTGNAVRDKWLEKLLQSLEKLCGSSYKNRSNFWPDKVIPIVAELERVAYEVLGNDLKKYSQKIRQLDYNLQKSEYLVQRLLQREIEPTSLVTMTPEELKNGLTADEMMIFEPEITEQMQMTDVRCIICGEKRVGIREVINAGGHGDRYQLECCECGHAWFSFRDAIASSLLPNPNHKS